MMIFNSTGSYECTTVQNCAALLTGHENCNRNLSAIRIVSTLSHAY
jgi:hypothetical protein